jgi:hypothetical protein
VKLAVVGHVEWVDVVLVDRLPVVGETWRLGTPGRRPPAAV